MLSIDADVMMGSATYSDAIQTAEISVLEPGTSDLAYYAEGVGLVLVESQAGTTERALVEYTPG